ncbi:hypothetical protein CHI14_28610 [Paenibacillus sp. 7516]|nr:hypothetical protein CHI14_28610 [Paenibacillus sp. 7516]
MPIGLYASHIWLLARALSLRILVQFNPDNPVGTKDFKISIANWTLIPSSLLKLIAMDSFEENLSVHKMID